MRNNAMRAATMWTIHCPGVFGLLRFSTRYSSTPRRMCEHAHPQRANWNPGLFRLISYCTGVQCASSCADKVSEECASTTPLSDLLLSR
jgi:hypothetical protein